MKICLAPDQAMLAGSRYHLPKLVGDMAPDERKTQRDHKDDADDDNDIERCYCSVKEVSGPFWFGAGGAADDNKDNSNHADGHDDGDEGFQSRSLEITLTMSVMMMMIMMD